MTNIYLYSVTDVAEVLQVHPVTVRRMIHRGQLKAVKLGTRLWRIQDNDLWDYIRRSNDVKATQSC